MSAGRTETVLLLLAVGGLLFAWLGAALRLAADHGSDAQPRSDAQLRSGGGASPGTAPWGERVFWGSIVVGLGAQTALVAVASARRGALAVYDQAEFLLAISWVLGLLSVFFVRRQRVWWLAVGVVPLNILLLGLVILVPGGSGAVRSASLTSTWLLVHILTSVVAYAAFTVTFVTGALCLLRRYSGRGPAKAAMERIGYQAAVFGFSFMTMVILSGALWAKFVWGRYWAWDPIEAWALVTWLVYAAYLHAQYSRGWRGIRAAWLSVAGFACVLATYLFFTHLWF